MTVKDAEPAARSAVPSATTGWRERYARGLVISDLVILIGVMFGVQVAWFGVTTSDVPFSGRLSGVALSYTVISVVLGSLQLVAARCSSLQLVAARRSSSCLSLLLLIAFTVRVSSAGSVLFRQERVGINGTRFHMLKFRSMVTGAEALLADLQVQQPDKGNTVLFKMANDPRVTAFSRTLRRFSLDELPQLFNVLKGSMSLVGPRPPLQREVDQYERRVYRRFIVKPGITGPWQVGGRSNLSWDDSVRLDLYYVENWSIVGDLSILLRTARAVFGRNGRT